MAPSRSFANYPPAQEASDLTYRWEEDKNPALRGLPLVAASTLISNAGFLQKYFWSNAGFGKVKELPDLGKQPWRFQPTVIPLADSASAYTMIPPSTPHSTPQPAGRPGRFASAADFHALYKSGAATPLQVMDALLPLVQRGQSPPSRYELAFLATNAEEVLAAAKASTDRWARGVPLGLLDGVPISVKCDVAVKGYVSTFGLRPRKDVELFRRVAPESVWSVRKLQEAGAIVVAQNNMHEVGMDTTGCNPATGTPINWYNTSYYPGGSSSGAGSCLGAGLVPIAIGTDAGGSVRVPPSYNGVFGLKPSHDRTGVRQGTNCVIGPMAATAADLTIAYRVMSQPDPEDPTQGKFAVSTVPDPSAKKIIGIPREWLKRSTPVMLEHYNKVIDHFKEKLGYEVVDIQLPYIREGQVAHAATCLTEGVDEARQRVANPDDWASLLNYPNRVLLTAGQHTPAVDYIKYGQIRQVIMQHLAFLWEKHPGLIVVTPTTPSAGWKIHPGDQKYGFSDGNKSIANMTYAWMANTTGCPAVTCPMGYADPEQGEGKIPMGIMATGEWGAEEQLLSWAGEVEDYLHDVYPGGRLRPKEWADVIGLATEKVKGLQKNGNGQ